MEIERGEEEAERLTEILKLKAVTGSRKNHQRVLLRADVETRELA